MLNNVGGDRASERSGAERQAAVDSKLRIALVHDWLATYTGAERVVEQILASFPQAKLFSLVDFLSDRDRDFLQGRTVQTSFLQRLPLARRYFRHYLALMPLAVEQFDLNEFDIVISSSHAVAKGVLTRSDQLHLSYVHTPIRYAWDLQNQYLTRTGLTSGARSAIVRTVLHYLRLWDRLSADRVDLFATNSNYVARRIRKIYSRPAIVVYPPVDIDAFAIEPHKLDYYVTASRLVPYKRVDLIVEAFAGLPDRQLVVIGDGPEFSRIAAKAGGNVKMAGYQSRDDLRRYLAQARAFIFAADEDFGIAPVEAQACGTPVIAYGVGGSRETVIDGTTGIFFNEQTPEGVAAAVKRFEDCRQEFDPQVIRRHTERFRPERFREQFENLVNTAWARFCAGQSVECID